MDTLHIRTSATFGRPRDVRGIPTASRVESFSIVEGVVNDPYEPAAGADVDELIAAFQAERSCKVSYPGAACGGVRLFEVFEPAYATPELAQAAADDLLARLVGHTLGRSTAHRRAQE